MSLDAAAPTGALDERAQEVLLRHRARFLAILERTTGSRAAAEDVLQGAYQRALERGAPTVEEQGLVAWFLAVLRNAWLDQLRRRAVEARGRGRLAAEDEEAQPAHELREAVCACLRDALAALRPGHADLVRQVDLEGRRLSEVAGEAGITPNNARVRLHRARQALGLQLGQLCGVCAVHGCLDCACRGTGTGHAP